MIFEIPLDQGRCTLFTDLRSGERTPTGAARRGLRSIPRRSRDAARSGQGQCPRSLRTGPPSASVGDGTASSGQGPKELMPPQLASARSVPTGTRTEGSGDRVSVKRCRRASQPVSRRRGSICGIARHASRRDGRCKQVELKVNARRSISGGPVPLETPRRARRRKPQRLRGAHIFQSRPTTPTPHGPQRRPPAHGPAGPGLREPPPGPAPESPAPRGPGSQGTGTWGTADPEQSAQLTSSHQSL